MNLQPTLFDGARMGIREAIDLTAASLQAHGSAYDHWAVAYSGGKDSTAVLTVVWHLIRTGRVRAPARLTVSYADTRMELPPLAAAARTILDMLRAEGVDVHVVLPPLDDRFFVYMFGRGVPPPTNRFRWCTGQIKVEPVDPEAPRPARPARQEREHGMGRTRPPGPLQRPVELHPYDAAAAQAQRAALSRIRAERDRVAVERALVRVTADAKSGANLMPAIVEAVKAYATVGEITQRLVGVFGRFREPVRFDHREEQAA